jgi:hypothetical protein
MLIWGERSTFLHGKARMTRCECIHLLIARPVPVVSSHPSLSMGGTTTRMSPPLAMEAASIASIASVALSRVASIASVALSRVASVSSIALSRGRTALCPLAPPRTFPACVAVAGGSGGAGLAGSRAGRGCRAIGGASRGRGGQRVSAGNVWPVERGHKYIIHLLTWDEFE